DADAHVRVGDLGTLGHVDHVAEQGQGGPQTGGGAVHGGDDGLRQVHQVHDDPAGFHEQRVQLRGGDRAKPIQIAAGGEGATFTRQHHRVDAAVRRNVGEHARQFRVQLAVDGV